MNTNKLAGDFSLPALIRFTVPTIVMMVFMALYQMVDGMFVSNFIGPEALSALNIVYPAISVVVALAVMLATGGSAIIARYMGEKRPQEARESLSLICLAGLAFGTLIALLGTVFMNPLLKLLGATPLIEAYCRDYLLILILTSPLSIFQMLFQNFFVTAGKPQLGLLVTVLGGLANIILDYLFIGPLQMGVTGAALATALGYAIPALFGLYYFGVRRKGTLYFVRPKLRWAVLWRACTNGSSEMVTNLATALTTFLFNSLMMRYAGETGVAAVTIILYSQFLLTAAFIGFSMGTAPLFSYSYGSGNRPRTAKLFRQSLFITLAGSLLILILAYPLAPYMVGIFARPESPVYALSLNGFYLFAVSFLFAGFNIYASALFTALSNGLVSAAISFSRTFVFLSASLLLLPLFWGLTGVWLAVPLAELISAAISLLFILKNRRRYGLTPRA